MSQLGGDEVAYKLCQPEIRWPTVGGSTGDRVGEAEASLRQTAMSRRCDFLLNVQHVAHSLHVYVCVCVCAYVCDKFLASILKIAPMT